MHSHIVAGPRVITRIWAIVALFGIIGGAAGAAPAAPSRGAAGLAGSRMLAPWPEPGQPRQDSPVGPRGGGASITLVQTVGLDSQTCATEDTLTVTAGTQVFYCYLVTNTGVVSLTHHTLVDDALGTVLSDLPYTLLPNASAFVTATAVVSETTMNLSTWTATDNASATASATDTALVTVAAVPKTIYLPLIITGRPNRPLGFPGPAIALPAPSGGG